VVSKNAKTTEPGSGPAAVAVLAGGLARRMDGSKSGSLLAGKPLIGHAVAAVSQAGLEPFIVTRGDRPSPLEGIETVFEPDGPRHPLAGVAAAIRHAGGRDVVVLACDMPLLAPAFIGWLAALPRGAAVPVCEGVAQPLAARYTAADLAAIESLLERQMPARTVIEALRPRLIAEDELRAFGDPGRMFFNVNNPDDLRRAEQLLTRK
jgi:molybdopterin-guanine dinucleotide biosynthesis protein A